MAKVIARFEKHRTAGTICAADSHARRERETPNADPEKEYLNRTLVGGDEPLWDAVQKVINEHGGKPRRNSVLCVEHFFGASPEWFEDKEGQRDPKSVEQLLGAWDRFREVREGMGEICVYAELHMDEKSPHVSWFTVPIDPRGRLNASYFYKSDDPKNPKAKARLYQDQAYDAARPFGLERGVRGSRATHQDVQDFYATIIEDVKPSVNVQQLPDPPRVFLSEAQRRDYKSKVAEAVCRQLAPQMTHLRDQAMLTFYEKGLKENAEKRAEAAKKALLKEGNAHSLTESKLMRAGWERDALRQAHDKLQQNQQPLRNQLTEERQRSQALAAEVAQFRNRMRDIPLVEVMQALGFQGEEKFKSTLYRRQDGAVALTINNNMAYNSAHQVVSNGCAVDLMLYIMRINKMEATPSNAVEILAEKFGPERATAAFVSYAEKVGNEITSPREEQVIQQDLDMSP